MLAIIPTISLTEALKGILVGLGVMYLFIVTRRAFWCMPIGHVRQDQRDEYYFCSSGSISGFGITTIDGVSTKYYFSRGVTVEPCAEGGEYKCGDLTYVQYKKRQEKRDARFPDGVCDYIVFAPPGTPPPESLPPPPQPQPPSCNHPEPLSCDENPRVSPPRLKTPERDEITAGIGQGNDDVGVQVEDVQTSIDDIEIKTEEDEEALQACVHQYPLQTEDFKGTSSPEKPDQEENGASNLDGGLKQSSITEWLLPRAVA